MKTLTPMELTVCLKEILERALFVAWCDPQDYSAISRVHENQSRIKTLSAEVMR